MPLLRRAGFCFVELLIVIAIIGVLIALLLPAVQAAREAARRTRCSKNLQQAGLALQSYHDGWNVFPFGQRGTDGGTDLSCNMGESSGWVPLAPHIGHPAVFQRIEQPQTFAGVSFSRFGPRPDATADADIANYRPWYIQPHILLCPSDPQTKKVPGRPGQSSYRFCWGDVIAHTNRRRVPRGMFGRNSGVNVAQITDGTSYTIAVAERAIAPRGPQPSVSVQWGVAVAVEGLDESPAASGAAVGGGGETITAPKTLDMSPMMWANGRLPFGGFTTTGPPNSPACLGPDGAVIDGRPRFDWGVVPPSSHHPGGIQALFADGSARFISETISVGNLNAPEATDGPSPYGVWGAFGTIRGGELESAYW